MCVFTLRDRESAYVSTNGVKCWTKQGLDGKIGTQECGLYVHKEERFRVSDCYVTLRPGEPLTVRVWTNLNGKANDESFAIDNVVIRKSQRPVDEGTIQQLVNYGTINKFNNANNFEGWNCGKITNCNWSLNQKPLGQMCGGYKVKGKGSALIKTFMLPPGTYSVELDFIKIDSW